jgi:hypothetical protein
MAAIRKNDVARMSGDLAVHLPRQRFAGLLAQAWSGLPESMPNWSFKADYLYTDPGSTTVNLSAPAFRNSDGEGFRTVTASNTMDARFQTVRVGFNHHFN